MGLQIHIDHVDSKTICLTLDGQLDAVTANDLEKSIQGSVTSEIGTLILNLEKLSYVSSAGLRIFAKTRKALKSRNGCLYFTSLSPQVKKVFDIVKAVPLSEVFMNTQELDAYLTVMQSQINEED